MHNIFMRNQQSTEYHILADSKAHSEISIELQRIAKQRFRIHFIAIHV